MPSLVHVSGNTEKPNPFSETQKNLPGWQETEMLHQGLLASRDTRLPRLAPTPVGEAVALARVLPVVAGASAHNFQVH